MASDTDDEPFSHGAIFGSYQILERIGRGGMASVWSAVHLTLRKPVAIKVLRVKAARERFLREGEAISRIRHAHVVEVHDIGFVNDVPYLVMERLDGEDLRTCLARRERLPLAELADIMVPVCAAVASAHDESVVHRDLKPGNIFLARTRDRGVVPKVLDFGMSRLLDDRGSRAQTVTSVILGTPRYMAPEQVRDARAADARSDQYALGVILYRAAVGRLPFEHPSAYELLRLVVAGDFLPPRAVLPELPADFEAIVLRAMSTAPEHRFGAVRELGAALLPYASARTQVLHEGALSHPHALLPAPPPSPELSVSTLSSTLPSASAEEPTSSVTLTGAPVELPSVAEATKHTAFRTRAIATAVTVAVSVFTMWAMTPSPPAPPPPHASPVVMSPTLAAPASAAPLPVAPLPVAPLPVAPLPVAPVVNTLRAEPVEVADAAVAAPVVAAPRETVRPAHPAVARRPRTPGRVNAHDID